MTTKRCPRFFFSNLTLLAAVGKLVRTQRNLHFKPRCWTSGAVVITGGALTSGSGSVVKAEVASGKTVIS